MTATDNKIDWKVEGMSCSNCALTISKYLEKEGLSDINVSFMGGEVSFALNGDKTKEEIAKGIKGLGYKVLTNELTETNKRKPFLSDHFQRFVFCLPFTLVLLMHMLPWHIHFLMNGWIQLAICLPVFIAIRN